MKRIIFFSLCITIFSHFFADEQPSYTPDNTIILWDLHDVILKKDIPGVIGLLVHYPNLWKVLIHINPKLMFGTLKLTAKSLFKREGFVSEFIALTQQSHNPFMQDLFIKMANKQKPIAGTIEIIKELYDLGYTHHLGSNIDETLFKDLTNPNKNPQFAYIFELFDLTKSHQVINGSNNIKKPNIEYFTNYLTKNNIDPTKTRIIFIDDLKVNIEAAKKAGLTGIQFISPAQLRSRLQEMHILSQPTPSSAA